MRCLIEGKVQGVFYRTSTMARANELGLSGWARNLADGRVEVVAQGSSDSVAELGAWFWQGPAAARVSTVTVEPWSDEVEAGFSVR